MRKVTGDVVSAFIDGRSRCVGNSSTDGEALFLHGNKIAWKGTHNGASCIFLTLAGWGTPTTRERLQGVLSMMGHRSPDLDDGTRPCLNVCQRDHAQCIAVHSLNGTPSESREISTTAVLAVVWPATAKGLAAVSIVSE